MNCCAVHHCCTRVVQGFCPPDSIHHQINHLLGGSISFTHFLKPSIAASLVMRPSMFEESVSETHCLICSSDHCRSNTSANFSLPSFLYRMFRASHSILTYLNKSSIASS